jgi:hypothetical protein
MTYPFQTWLENHLEDATAEYERAQALEERGSDDEEEEDPEETGELYDRVHQMWGYLSGLEKCLKEFKARSK